MPFYIVTLAAGACIPLQGDARSCIVHAESSADALAAAKSQVTWDNDAAWASATATELTAATTLEGVEIRAISGSNADAYNRTYSFTGLANATLADLATGLAAAMNADATNFPSGVTASGKVVTIAGGNNVGDLTISCALYKNGVAFASVGVAVSATGAEGDARTITLSGGTLEGSRLRITIADNTNPVDVSVFCHDGETIDQAGARILVLLNAATLIGGTDATYSSNVISIPADNNVGAKVITATWTRDGVALPEMALTVSATGSAGSIRTITFPADGTLPVPRQPKVLNAVKVEA